MHQVEKRSSKKFDFTWITFLLANQILPIKKILKLNMAANNFSEHARELGQQKQQQFGNDQ